MSRIVGGRDETEEKEDKVWHTKDAGELLVDDLLSVGHLLLGVSPESVPPDNFLPPIFKDSVQTLFIHFACIIIKTVFFKEGKIN